MKTKSFMYVGYLLLALSFAMMSTGGYAQPKNGNKNSRLISGQVLDYITHSRLPKVKVALLRPDSTVIDSVEAGGTVQNDQRITYLSNWYFNVAGSGTYLLRFSFAGYQTQYYTFKAKFGRREYYVTAPDIFMKRDEVRQLAEVTVTATKVKFYNKGDTIVYNADAFKLSEGSMLDALIRQMPGAELKPDGRIYVNGKFVESLLLNGKNFFKGNNQVMLENLPTYMVSNVKVYEKQGKTSEFMGHDTGDKKLVMDVNLKKQYSIGWIGNMEVGAGTHNRYLARLFANRFSDHSHVTLYGTVNNLNDTRKPGENDTWKPTDLQGGLMSTKMAGIDYGIDSRSQKFEMGGNIELKHTDTDNLSTVHRENFLTGGNTFDRMNNLTRRYDTKLSTNNDITFKNSKVMVMLSHTLDYNKYDHRSSYQSATFAQDISNYNQQTLDSIFTPNMGSYLRSLAINRNMQMQKAKGHTLETEFEVWSVFKIPHSSDRWQFGSALNYKDDSYDRFGRNRIDYFSAKNTSTDFRNQYTSAHPRHGWEYRGNLQYTYTLNKGLTISPYYAYKMNNFQGSDVSLYRLDKLTGWGSDTKYELGMLPSQAEMLSTRDARNSYNATQHDKTHSAGVSIWMNKNSGKYFYWVQADLSLNFLRQKMHYTRAAIDTTFARHNAYFRSSNTFLQIQSNDRTKTFFTNYETEYNTPDMAYLVRTRDDSDPLQIIVGNPNLKSTYRHKWYAMYSQSNTSHQSSYDVSFAFNLTTNALAMGYTYDKATGVRTITPDNVNGNWDGNIGVGYETGLGKKNLFTLSLRASETYYHNIDLAGVSGSNESSRSVVNTSMLGQKIKLTYNLGGGSSVGIKGSGTWTRATGSRADFSTINAGDFNYGLTALVNLPMKWQISTDLTMYSRRGYEDKSMNTNDLVWNARLSKPLAHGKLLFMLDGFDLLGNLSNVTRTLTAQARVEQYTNVLPRYIMAHLVYRLSIKPKKK